MSVASAAALIDLLVAANEDAVEEEDSSGASPLSMVSAALVHDSVTLAVLARLLAGASCSALLGSRTPRTTPLHTAVDWSSRAGGEDAERAAEGVAGEDAARRIQVRARRQSLNAATAATMVRTYLERTSANSPGGTSVRARARARVAAGLVPPPSPDRDQDLDPELSLKRARSPSPPRAPASGVRVLMNEVHECASHLRAVEALLRAAPAWRAQCDGAERTPHDVARATGAPAAIVALVAEDGRTGADRSAPPQTAAEGLVLFATMNRNRRFVATNMAEGAVQGLLEGVMLAAKASIVALVVGEAAQECAS